MVAIFFTSLIIIAAVCIPAIAAAAVEGNAYDKEQAAKAKAQQEDDDMDAMYMVKANGYQRPVWMSDDQAQRLGL